MQGTHMGGPKEEGGREVNGMFDVSNWAVGWALRIIGEKTTNKKKLERMRSQQTAHLNLSFFFLVVSCRFVCF